MVFGVNYALKAEAMKKKKTNNLMKLGVYSNKKKPIYVSNNQTKQERRKDEEADRRER